MMKPLMNNCAVEAELSPLRLRSLVSPLFSTYFTCPSPENEKATRQQATDDEHRARHHREHEGTKAKDERERTNNRQQRNRNNNGHLARPAPEHSAAPAPAVIHSFTTTVVE